MAKKKIKQELTEEEKKNQLIERQQNRMRKMCIEHILANLTEHGYILENTDFNFDWGIAEFDVKEFPKWRFGLWVYFNKVDEDYEYFKVEFFTQFKKDINKFKPSRSHFVETCTFACYKGYRWKPWFDETVQSFVEYSMENIFTFLREHPYRAWARSSYDEGDIYSLPWSGFKCWRKYVSHMRKLRFAQKYEDWADGRLIAFLKKHVLVQYNDWEMVKHKNRFPTYSFYAPIGPNKNVVSSSGCYPLIPGNYCRQLLANKDCTQEDREYAESVLALEKRYDRKVHRLERLSRVFEVYYSSNVSLVIDVLTKKQYRQEMKLNALLNDI